MMDVTNSMNAESGICEKKAICVHP